MSECLVTKLKSTVNNDNLVYFNKLRIQSLYNPKFSYTWLSLYSRINNLNQKAKVAKGQVTFYNGAQSGANETTIYTEWNGTFASGGFRTTNVDGLILIDKYALYKVKSDGRYVCPLYFYAEDVSNSNVEEIVGCSVIGDIKYLSVNQNFKKIQEMSGAKGLKIQVFGNISNFKGHPSLEQISISQCGSNIYGLLDDLGYCPHIYGIGLNYTNIHGSIEGFVANQKSIGRKNATITITGGGNNVTYNGVIENRNAKIVFDNEGEATITMSY